MFNRIKFKLTYVQLILLGFLAVILAGTLLLCTPLASRSGQWTPLLTSLFTATSATCVTGLIVVNTFLHWSAFGQIVILVLIQIGGLGVMTVITMFFVFLRRKLSLHETKLVMQSAGGTENGLALPLIKRILVLTGCFELLGFFLLATQFCPRMGLLRGLYYALFHSVSAFCNAGFDIMGQFGQASFTGYTHNIVVNLTICMLIICGGLGFLVWSDVLHRRFRLRKCYLHTKLVLISTIVLILLGWGLFYLLEYNHSMAGLKGVDKVIAALFQSVSPRTAGFNTVDQAALSQSGSALTVILMFIGASPGSTGGGVKTTTVVIMLLSILSATKKDNSITVFKRRVDAGTVRQVNVILSIYLLAIVAATLIICAIDPFPLHAVVFEVVSAIGTVGLSTGITPALSPASQVIIILLMYIGRMGGLTMALSLTKKRAYVPVERPTEKLLIG